jgi:hypothetical protein
VNKNAHLIVDPRKQKEHSPRKKLRNARLYSEKYLPYSDCIENNLILYHDSWDNNI